MNKIYTSYYGNKKVDWTKYYTVRISNSAPAWFTTDDYINNLAPDWDIVESCHNNESEYRKQYFRYLDNLNGRGFVVNFFKKFRNLTDGKDIVLLCYENLENHFCHRRMFAEWWKDKTGEEINEL